MSESNRALSVNSSNNKTLKQSSVQALPELLLIYILLEDTVLKSYTIIVKSVEFGESFEKRFEDVAADLVDAEYIFNTLRENTVTPESAEYILDELICEIILRSKR